MALRDLLIKITADGLDVDRELQRSARSVKRFGRDLQGVGQQLTVGLTVPLTAAGFGMLELASSAQELGAKFKAVFRELAPEVDAWAGQTAEALGRSSTELEGFLARLQDTFVPLGFTRRAAADYSKQLTTLALDVAAFNDVADDEVLRDFTSAVVGNQEAVRKYGIILTQTALKAELMRMGVANSVQAATEQEKVQARVNIILQATADAHGIAAQEAEGYAAGQKSLVAALKDTAEVLGKDLLPLANALQRTVTDQIRGVGAASDSSRRWALALGIVAAAIGPLVTALGVLTIAVGSLASALSVGLLPLLAVGAPILIGIGLVSAGFVKMKIDAANAGGTIDDFAASLRGLDRAMLMHQQRVATLKAAEALEANDRVVFDRLVLQSVAIGEALDRLKEETGGGGDGSSGGVSPVREILSDLEEGLRVAREMSRLTADAFGGSGAGEAALRSLSEQGRGFRLAREEAELYLKTIRELVESGLSIDSDQVQEVERKRRDALIASINTNAFDAPVFSETALVGPLREIPELLGMISHRSRYIIEQTSEWAFELATLREVGLGFADTFASTIVDAVDNGKEAFTRFRDHVLAGLGEILVKLALFKAANALFPGSGIASFIGDAFGFSGAAPALNLDFAAGLAPKSFGAPVAAPSLAVQIDLSQLPAPMDPRQAARDPEWVGFLHHSLRVVYAGGGG